MTPTEEQALIIRDAAKRDEENKLLILQLQLVKEELARYYLLNQNNKKLLANSASVENSHSPNSGGVLNKILYRLTKMLGMPMVGQIGTIKASGLFDQKWYLNKYPDVMKARMDPIEHYLRFGAKEGRNPGPQFDTKWYLASYKDVANSKMNPLLHYLNYGKKEGRKPKNTNKEHNPTDSLAAERVRLVADRDTQSRLAEERAAQIRELNQVLAQATKLAEEREAQIAELNRALDQATKLAKERAAQIAELNKALDQANKLTEGRAAQIAELNKALDQANKLTEGRAAQIAELNSTRISTNQQLQSAKVTLDVVNKEKAELIRTQSITVKELKEALFEAQQTASLSVKLQTLREADLKDLQCRYQDSLSKQEEQFRLLTKLGERLWSASNYFHQIANGSPASSPAIEENSEPVINLSHAQTTRGSTEKSGGGT